MMYGVCVGGGNNVGWTSPDSCSRQPETRTNKTNKVPHIPFAVRIIDILPEGQLYSKMAAPSVAVQI